MIQLAKHGRLSSFVAVIAQVRSDADAAVMFLRRWEHGRMGSGGRGAQGGRRLACQFMYERKSFRQVARYIRHCGPIDRTFVDLGIEPSNEVAVEHASVHSCVVVV